MSLDNRQHDESDDWAKQYVRICRKRLDDQPLTAKERDFEAVVLLLAERLPGVVEDALLSRPPETVRLRDVFAAASPASKVERLAASTSGAALSCYELVIEAIKEGKASIDADLGNGDVALLKILPDEVLVRACCPAHFVFTIEWPDGSDTLVGEFEEQIRFEDLKSMSLEINPGRKIIRLRKV